MYLMISLQRREYLIKNKYTSSDFLAISGGIEWRSACGCSDDTAS